MRRDKTRQPPSTEPKNKNMVPPNPQKTTKDKGDSTTYTHGRAGPHPLTAAAAAAAGEKAHSRQEQTSSTRLLSNRQTVSYVSHWRRVALPAGLATTSQATPQHGFPTASDSASIETRFQTHVYVLPKVAAAAAYMVMKCRGLRLRKNESDEDYFIIGALDPYSPPLPAAD